MKYSFFILSLFLIMIFINTDLLSKDNVWFVDGKKMNFPAGKIKIDGTKEQKKIALKTYLFVESSKTINFQYAYREKTNISLNGKLIYKDDFSAGVEYETIIGGENAKITKSTEIFKANYDTKWHATQYTYQSQINQAKMNFVFMGNNIKLKSRRNKTCGRLLVKIDDIYLGPTDKGKDILIDNELGAFTGIPYASYLEQYGTLENYIYEIGTNLSADYLHTLTLEVIGDSPQHRNMYSSDYWTIVYSIIVTSLPKKISLKLNKGWNEIEIYIESSKDGVMLDISPGLYESVIKTSASRKRLN